MDGVPVGVWDLFLLDIYADSDDMAMLSRMKPRARPLVQQSDSVDNQIGL